MADGTTLPAHAVGRRGSADAVDPRASQQVRTLRLSTDHSVAETGGVASRQGSSAAHLAARRLEGSRPPEATRAIVVERWQLHPAASAASEPCMELRFRGCADS